jgi:hypothetical protein
MKEYVLVEFLFTAQKAPTELIKLNELGDDFILIKCNDYGIEGWPRFTRVSGKINSQTASLIKLQNPALAGKMRISYIPEELKDKYRR